MTIVLINPRTTRTGSREAFRREPPNGLLTLSAVLEANGHFSRILDLEQVNNPYNKIAEALEGASLVGLSFLTATFPLAVDIANICQELAPDVPLIAGGPHASFRPAECFEKMPNLSAIVTGEGETQICQLVDTLLASPNKQNDIALKKVPGISFLEVNGNVSHTAPAPTVDVTTLPLPARHLLSSEYDVATVIVNRGCPNQCSFCSRQALFRTVRVRPVSHVLEELIQVQSLFNYQYVNLYDNVNMYPDFLPTLCSGMRKAHFKLPWGAEIRIDHLTPAVAREMKAVNCAGVATGIETANDTLLRANGKVQKIADVRRGLEVAIEADLTVQVYFVLGLPGETRDSFEETLAFLETSPLRPGRDMVNFFPATPYPGSRLAEQQENMGWELLNPTYSEWDCHHVVICPLTLTLAELRECFEEARAFEAKFNGGNLHNAISNPDVDA